MFRHAPFKNLFTMGLGIADLISSVAGTVANVNSQRETNYYNYVMNDQNNKANADLAAKQNEWNVAQWENENDYNKPEKQVERLRAAGLSASAAAQNIEGAGNSAHLESADLANQQAFQATAPQIDLSALSGVGSGLLNIMRNYEQWRIEHSAANRADEKNDAELQSLYTNNDLRQWQTNRLKQQFEYDAEANKYHLRGLKYEVNTKRSNSKIASLKVEGEALRNMEVDANVKLARQKFDFLAKRNDAELKQMAKELEEADSRIRKNLSEAGLNEQERKVKFQEEVSKEYDNILKKWGAGNDVASRTAALLAEGKLNIHDVDKVFLGTREYCHKGAQWYGPDPFTRPYLDNVLNIGRGEDQDRRLNYMNFGLNSFDKVKDTLMPWNGSNTGAGVLSKFIK